MTKEELEKEAEKHADGIYHYKINVSDYGEDGIINYRYSDVKEAYQKGAEFGYNKGQSDQLVYKQYQLRKANGWHKQEADDIYDLIAEDWSVRYFICIMKDKSRVTAIGNCDEGCNGEVSVNLFFEHDDEKYYLDDIVWWKEIVLPKESE